jgi:hypothetical protein
MEHRRRDRTSTVFSMLAGSRFLFITSIDSA